MQKRRRHGWPENKNPLLLFAEEDFMLSGRQDSNLRPPGPKPGAMTGLRYAPNSLENYFPLGNAKI